MAKDKVAPTTEKDLTEYVFFLDLDNTITLTDEHYQKRVSGNAAAEIEFVPGVLEFISDIFKRGAKIAIISHSGGKTRYLRAALDALNKIGITDIPYISLLETTVHAIENNHHGIRITKQHDKVYIALANLNSCYICIKGQDKRWYQKIGQVVKDKNCYT